MTSEQHTNAGAEPVARNETRDRTRDRTRDGTPIPTSPDLTYKGREGEGEGGPTNARVGRAPWSPPSNLCPADHAKPVTVDAPMRICAGCLDRLMQNLAALPGLYRACELALIGGGGDLRGDKINYQPEPGINLNQAALDARTAIEAELHSWTRIVLEERDLDYQPANTTTTLAAFLVTHATWLAQQDFAAEVARTIADTYREAKRAAYPVSITKVRVSACVVQGCDGDLIAYLRKDDDLLPSVIRCTALIEHEYPTDQWRSLGRKIANDGYADLLRALS